MSNVEKRDLSISDISAVSLKITLNKGESHTIDLTPYTTGSIQFVKGTVGVGYSNDGTTFNYENEFGNALLLSSPNILKLEASMPYNYVKIMSSSDSIVCVYLKG